jgi:GNAT superfamily N-acetyltransferase
MTLSSFDAVPAAPLPDGFSFRNYQPGDEAGWVELYGAAEKYIDISRRIFDDEFHDDTEALSSRMSFIRDAKGKFVGTSCAWYDDISNDGAWGRIHWVAIHPEYQGRGLAKPLLTHSLECLKKLGHEHAYLITSTARVPAITLYLKYGFLPDARSPKERSAWEKLAEDLRREYREVVLKTLE